MSRTALTARSARAARTVTFGIAAMVALGACGAADQAGPAPVGSSSPSSPSSPAPAAATAHPRDEGTALAYVKIVEPFGAPGACRADGTTIEMTACILREVVEVDFTVDVLQQQRFTYSVSEAEREADLRDDARWLAQRTTTCSANPAGGSIGRLNEAQCLLEAGQARVASLS
jgi:uncharacterized protein YecT (DUF1311 family)